MSLTVVSHIKQTMAKVKKKCNYYNFIQFYKGKNIKEGYIPYKVKYQTYLMTCFIWLI